MRPSLTTTLRELLRAPPRGVALVEFGLAAPILIVLIIGVVDFGLAFYAGLQVEGSAAAGAQYASRHSWDCNAIQNIVINTGNYSGIIAPAPQQVCGCPGTGALAPFVSAPTTLSVCPATPTTTCSGICSDGTPVGTYAYVQSKLSYSTLIYYPGVSNPLLLSGQAYRRIQ